MSSSVLVTRGGVLFGALCLERERELAPLSGLSDADDVWSVYGHNSGYSTVHRRTIVYVMFLAGRHTTLNTVRYGTVT